MAEDNVKAQMRKGILEYCILAILSRGDSYAPRIIAELKAAEMIVVEGTLYPILTRQKNAGLLTYRWEESPQGPPRKYYTLTEKGREALRTLDQAWIEKVQQIDVIRHGGKPAENRSTDLRTKETTLRLHAVAALRTTEGAVSDGGRRDMTTGGVESLRNHTRSIRNRHKPITP